MVTNKIVNTTVVITTVVFLISSIFIASCCKNKPTPTPAKTCGTNQILVNDSCVCDNNSVWNGSQCIYTIKGFSNKFVGYTHLNKSITNNCNDWRDSIFIPFINNDFSSNSNILSIGQIKGDSVWASGELQVAYYKNGLLYDSLASDLGTMDLTPLDKDFAIYIKTTKTRDTMWATVCNVTINPFYKRVDTCHVVLTKVF